MVPLLFALILSVNCLCAVNAQPENTNIWTWISGDSNIYPTSHHGELRNTSADSTPGCRNGAAGLYDSSRTELWLFGGYGCFGINTLGDFNDLWKYQMNDSTWTWISGSTTGFKLGAYGEKGNASIDNVPGSRSGVVGWFDSISQELWIFGGYGYAKNWTKGYLNDLWRFRVNDSTWTWISGEDVVDKPGVYGGKGNASTTNLPHPRREPTTWYDSSAQELWLFGGWGSVGKQYVYLNDVWKYRINDSTWTWISGNDSYDQYGVYGEKGKTSAGSVPGARYGATGWYDSSTKELWLFGGYGYSKNDFGWLNDLWKYRMEDNTWTWISGHDTTDEQGVYGNKGVANTTNVPGARRSPAAWYDASAKELWLFGGYGHGNVSSGYLNDMWRFRIRDSTWTWVSGNTTEDNAGVYGEKLVPSLENIPGSRETPVAWFDNSTREVWLYGGYGYGNHTEEDGILGDLWKATLPEPEPEPEPVDPEPEPEDPEPEPEELTPDDATTSSVISVVMTIFVLAAMLVV